jgi:hypothetical protein
MGICASEQALKPSEGYDGNPIIMSQAISLQFHF